MLQLNKDHVRVVEGVPWENKSGRQASYELQSSLDEFVLNGTTEGGFWKVVNDPKTQILIVGINNTYGANTEKHSPRYKLEFKGLLIPEEKFENLNGLKLNLTEVRRSKFRAELVQDGTSFLVRTNDPKYRIVRVDYVISPKHKQLNDVLEALGAPEDLLVRS